MKYKKNYLYIGIIFVVTCVILSSLFFNDRYQGHDTIFHVSNIIRLSDTISFDNIFGSDILKYELTDFSYGLFGYGIGLFYPRMPHLIASYIYLLFDDIYISMNIVYFITTLLSGIFTYFLADRIYKNKNIALLSAVIYITIPYHVCEIYIRDAFAENFMFLVLPMIFLGLYNLKDGNYNKFYVLFCLGYIIGINSHLVSMMFYTFLIGIFILYYRKYFLKKDKFMALVKGTILVTIMVLPYLVTLLEHKSLGIYRVFTSAMAEVEEISILKLKDLYTQEVIYDDIMPYFNISSIILFIFTTVDLFFSKKDKNKSDNKIFLLLIFITINLLCSNIIWDNAPDLLLSIQFPWRLLVFMGLIISLYVPSILNSNILKEYIGKKKIFRYVFGCCFTILFVIIIYEGYGNIKYHTDELVDIEVAMDSKLSLGYSREYFPKLDYVADIYGSNYFPQKSYAFMTSEDVLIDIISDDFPNIEFEVSNVDKSAIIEIPRTFYLGYKLVNDKNKKIELDYTANGLLKVQIEEDGIYKLSYGKTITVKIMQVIRIITILVMGIVLVVKLIRWKRKKLQY